MTRSRPARSAPATSAAEIGEVLIGAAPGRTSAGGAHGLPSLGLAVEDLAAAEYVVRRARERGAGTEVEF